MDLRSLFPSTRSSMVTPDRALSGLFTVLGQEEKKIRDDPVARTTDLLRRVFGRE